MTDQQAEPGGIFKYLLRRKRAYKYAFDGDDDEEPEPQAKLKGYKALVQKHAEEGSLHTFRDSEKERVKKYRAALTEDKVQKNRELQRVRQARYREKKKKEREASGSTRAAADKTRKLEEERKAAHREKMRIWRAKLTPEKRALHNMKRMERYRKLKESPQTPPTKATNSSPLQNLPPSSFAGSPYKCGEARRQAASRASRHDPKDPVKFAEVKVYQLQQALKSPRKRSALQRAGLPGLKMPPFADRLLQHLKELKGRRKKKDVFKRKQLLSVLVKGSTESISGLSHQLDQRWHFVAAASTLQPEEEELLQTRRHGGALDEDLCKEVAEFYSRPESCVIIPDRKVVKKDLVPRACLTSSLADLHRRFLRESSKKVSLTAFKKLRPQHIMTMDKMKRTSCLCKMCTNVAQKLEVLRSVCPSLPSTPMELLDLTLCKDRSTTEHWSCVDRECPDCGVQLLSQALVDLPLDKNTTWLKWQPYSTSSGQRIGNLTMKGTLGELVAELTEELRPFASHLEVAFWQYRQFRQLRENLPPNQVLTLLDFAENYRCEFQHEVQAAHWSYTQVSVLPTVNYYRCTCGELVTESVVFISSDLQHDASAVHACTALLLDHLKRERQLTIEHQYQFTDGAGSQFKSREPLTDLTCCYQDFGIPIERSFFGSSHGKGPCDGIGGIVKSAARRAVLSGKEVIRNADEMTQFLSKDFSVNPTGSGCCHSRRVFVQLEGIGRQRPDRRPKNPVPGTRAIHCARSGGKNVLMHRRLSCYCGDCISGNPCETVRALPHCQWKRHHFQCPQAPPTAQQKPTVAETHNPSAPQSAIPSDTTASTQAATPQRARSASTKVDPTQSAATPPESTKAATPQPVSPLKSQAAPTQSTPPESTKAATPQPVSPLKSRAAPTQSAPPGSTQAASHQPDSPSSTQGEDLRAASPPTLAASAPFPCSQSPSPRTVKSILDSLREVSNWQDLEAAAAQMERHLLPAELGNSFGSLITDQQSVDLYPLDGPSTLTPFAIYGDGNCLPRCGSVLAWGTQERHLEMRWRIALELILHKTFYLGEDSCLGDLPLFSAQYSEHFRGEHLTPASVARIYEAEVRDVLRPGTYMGMWQVLAMASVLRHPIWSLYPSYGGFTVRPHLHRICHPRVAAAETPGILPGVLWTHTLGKHLPAVTWRPNHFVVCLPSSNVDSSPISSVKPGDFILVAVPKEAGAVDYVAQITKVTAEGAWGVFLKDAGHQKWKWPEKWAEFFIPPCDVRRVFKEEDYKMSMEHRTLVYMFDM